MKIKVNPQGFRLTVKIRSAEREHTTSEGKKIILADQTVDREQNGGVIGEVLAIGSGCWDGGEPWCKVGDHVIIAKYGGCYLKNMGLAEDDVRIINDEDVLGTVEGLDG